MSEKKELSMADSLLLAARINVIKGVLISTKDEAIQESLTTQARQFIEGELPPLNEEDVFLYAEQMRSQASWQESAAVLNPNHNLTKNDILRKQGEALKHFGNFIKALKEADELLKKANREDVTMAQVRDMFV